MNLFIISLLDANIACSTLPLSEKFSPTVLVELIEHHVNLSYGIVCWARGELLTYGVTCEVLWSNFEDVV